MSQAATINVIPSSSDITDLLSKSQIVVESIKKENEENSNPFVGKTRRGKKNELMPTNSKIIELQEFNAKKTDAANNQKPGDDSVNGTSIYFRLALLFVNNLMQTNQLDMAAQALGLQANQKAMELVQQGFANLNTELSKPETFDSSKANSYQQGTAWGGIGGAILGGVLICLAVGLAPFTGGLSLGLIAIGVTLIAAGAAVSATGQVTYQMNKNQAGSSGLLNSLMDDMGGADPTKIVTNQTLSNFLTGQAQTVNNKTSANMQSLQNINSLMQQFSSMFAQMMSYYSSSMGR